MMVNLLGWTVWILMMDASNENLKVVIHGNTNDSLEALMMDGYTSGWLMLMIHANGQFRNGLS